MTDPPPLTGTDEYGFNIGPIELKNVHPETKCSGRPCVIHNPSDHCMRAWPMHWRADKGLMERLCPDHGTGHPDPDDIAWHESEGRSYMGIHACCSCCI